MEKTLEISKLTALRLKTDRELAIFIENRLRSATEADAAQIQDEVRELLPLVDGLSRTDRRRLEARLAQLKNLADAPAPARIMTMCG